MRTKLLKISATLALILSASSSFAYYSTIESGEVIPEGAYRFGAEPQMRLSEGNGFNFSGFADMGLGNDMSARAQLGSGDTELLASASFKWIPFPDYKNQPALGGKAEVMFGKKSGDGLWGVKIHPLASKKVDTDMGLFIPYGSIPIGYLSYKSETVTTIQLVAGTEFKTDKFKDWVFGAELGLNGSKAFNYISAFVTLPFDMAPRKSAPPPVTPAKKRKG